MPKIMENMESKLLEEAKKQLYEVGYGALTIRSVAKACGVGIGTVYNYCTSKDAMIAQVMMKDLDACVLAIQNAGVQFHCVEPVLRCVYDQLVLFAKQHRGMFRNKDEATIFLGSFNAYRERLRAQIAQTLRPYCRSDFASEFVAEAMLTWTMAKKNFDDIYGIVKDIVNQSES